MRTNRKFRRQQEQDELATTSSSSSDGKGFNPAFLRCWICGRLGHKSGDTACPKRGKGKDDGKKAKPSGKGKRSKGKLRPAFLATGLFGMMWQFILIIFTTLPRMVLMAKIPPVHCLTAEYDEAFLDAFLRMDRVRSRRQRMHYERCWRWWD